MATTTEKILAASAGRDRVSDAVKALALCLVIVGHSLAWTAQPGGTAVNTLEEAPQLFWLTWILQILPLFFLLAGTGLSRPPSAISGPDLKRADRLTSPAVPLLLITTVLAVIINSAAGGSVASAAGILPVQLVWFLGVYLLIVAIAPLLSKLTHLWHYAAFLAAIAAVDWLRVNVNENIGWLNLVLVWSLFTAIGMQLPRLRRVSKPLLFAWLVGAIAAATALIILGPYSPALITTTAIDGISNLAPPTIVLAFAGLAQIAALLLVWDKIGAFLTKDKVWIPVAVFASRAMGLYLWHMLFLALGIAVVLKTGYSPDALTLGWWAVHILVLLVAVSAVWFLAPSLLKLGDKAADLCARIFGRKAGLRASDSKPWAGKALAVVVGLNLIMISESGVANPFEPRTVLGVPYLPAVSLLIILLCVGLARAARPEPAKQGVSKKEG